MKALHIVGKLVDIGFARFLIAEPILKPLAQRIDHELHLGIRAVREQLAEIGGILLGENARRDDFAVQLLAKRRVRLFRLERRALAVFDERLEDGLGVVGEVHHHDPVLGFKAAIQPRNGLYRVAVDHRLVEKHPRK